LTLFAIMKGDQNIQSVTVTGSDPEGNPLSWNVPVVMYSEDELLHKLSAASLIRDLQESEEITSQIKQEIIGISLQYQIASKYTSFVGSSTKDTATTGTMIQHSIPLLPPIIPLSGGLSTRKSHKSSKNRGTGYGFSSISKKRKYIGTQDRVRDRGRYRYDSTQSYLPIESFDEPELLCLGKSFDESFENSVSRLSSSRSRSRSRSPRRARSPPRAKPPVPSLIQPSSLPLNRLGKLKEEMVKEGRSLLEITNLQAANGSWKKYNVETMVGIKTSNLEWVCSVDKDSVENIEDLLATCLMIAFIQINFPKEQEIWKMVVHKARLFIINSLSKNMKKTNAANEVQLLIDSGTQCLMKNK